MIVVGYSGTDTWLSKMQDETSLTLHWYSVLGGERDKPTTVFAHNGGHRIGYTIKSLYSAWIIHDGRPIIVDALLTLIFRR